MTTTGELLEGFWVHTVTVKARNGSTGLGPTYTDPATVACFVEDKRRLVRDADGAQVVSETTLYAPTGAADTLTVGALVTLPSGRIATIITTATLTSGELDLPDHVEAALT